ncbi:MAG: DUF2436 domain-containing protein, partial [Bacteroidaceae bacterium]|nr:DUF2436 domain-containing protein [Bacteroidaceae bacterium]
MSKKLILFLMVLLFGSANFLRADELTVGEGTTTNSYIPAYGLYVDTDGTTSEFIIPASELTAMNGQAISQMSFYVSTAPAEAWTATFQVYLAEVEETAYAEAAVYGVEAGTVVYTGTLDATLGETLDIVFDDAYTYNGGNLLVGTYVLEAGNYKSAYFYGDATEDYAGVYSYSGWSGFSTYRQQFIAKTTFTYDGGGVPPTPPTPGEWNPNPNVTMTTLEIVAPEHMAQNVENPVMLTWRPDLNAVEYKLEFGTTYPPATVIDWDTIRGENITIDTLGYYMAGNLDINTRYFWRVSIRNSKNTLVSPLNNFVTMMSTPQNVQLTETEIFEGETTTVKWKSGVPGGGFTGEITVADGTQTSTMVPVYGLWMDDYTRSEMIYPEEMIEEMMGGEITQLKYYISSSATGPWTGNVYNVYMMEVDGTTLSSYYTSANAQIVYTGGLDGQGTDMTIALDTPYLYNGGNLLVGIEETTTGTWKSCTFLGVTATGASAAGYSGSSLSAVAFNQQNFLPKTTFTCGSKGGDRSLVGYNVYVDNVKKNTNVLTGNQYTITGLTYNPEGYAINVRAVYNEGESLNDTYDNVVYVSGTGTIAGEVTELISGEPIQGANVEFNGIDEFGNVVVLNATTTGVGEYLIENAPVGNYTVGKATKAGMEPNFMEEDVDVLFEQTTNVDFVMHEVYNPVYGVVAEDMNGVLAMVKWSMNEIVVPPTPGPGGNNVTVKLTAGDNWGDGSGYQMLLDDTHSLYGSTIPTSGALSMNCSGNEGIYSQFSHKIPTNADGNCSTSNIVFNNTIEITIPAGTYDWCVTNPTPGDRIWIAGENGNVGGRYDDYVFEAGRTYEFTVSRFGNYDGVDVTVTGGKVMDQPKMAIPSTDVKTAEDYVVNNSRGNRNVQHFTLYKKVVLAQTMPQVDSVLVADNLTDTAYADFTYANDPAGIYQYGVSAVYPSPDYGKGERSQLVYNFENGTIPTVFNNAVTPQYPWIVVDANGGKAIQSSNGGVSSSTSSISLTYQYPSAGTFSFDAECMGEGTSSIWDKCQFFIDGVKKYEYGANNAGWHNYSYDIEPGEHTFLWTYSKDGSVNPTGDYMRVDNITIECQGAGETNDDPITPVVWSNYITKDMETTVTVNATINTGTVEGATLVMTNVNENVAYEVTFDEEGVIEIEDFRKGEYVVTVALEGFSSNYEEEEVSIWGETTLNAVLTEIKASVESFLVSATGFARWTDMLPTPDVALSYKLKLNNAPVADGITDNYYQFENLTEGNTYTAAIAVNYTTGMSAYVEATFTYEGCDYVETQVDSLVGTAQGMDIMLSWNGGTPTPPTPPSGGWTEGFENGLNGWSVITVNADGGEWLHSTNNPGGYDYTTLAHGGTGFALCYSFVDYVGAFDTDSYLVTPQMNSVVNGSTLTFFADNANDTYPENFSVCVATAANPTASDFTSVWSGGAKGTVSDGAMLRHTNNRYENWRQHTIDLSAYAGQNVWIAFHDANYDAYEIWIDDVTFTTDEKAPAHVDGCGTHVANNTSRAMWDVLLTFNAAEGGQYGVVTDGEYIYTSNWGYSSAANNFYKYDMDGNMIEGFNITGCGTLRGMTFDGEYIYGVANSATVYCVDLNNHTLVSTFTSSYGAMRCISYDSERNGFWVVGNWSGNLALIDYTGAIVQTGPEPESASDVAYWKDADGVEHVYCFNNGDGGVYDYNITTNTMGGQVYNFFNVPGASSSASSGGCHIANYGDKLAFYGDFQQSPNLIGILELGAAQGGGGGAATALQPNKFNIFVDGEIYGATANNNFTLTATDTNPHVYTVVFVDADYNISCEAEVTVAAQESCDPVTNLQVFEYEYQGYASIAATWDAATGAIGYKVYQDGELLGQLAGTSVVIYNQGAPIAPGTYTIGIVAVYANCE